MGKAQHNIHTQRTTHTSAHIVCQSLSQMQNCVFSLILQENNSDVKLFLVCVCPVEPHQTEAYLVLIVWLLVCPFCFVLLLFICLSQLWDTELTPADACVALGRSIIYHRQITHSKRQQVCFMKYKLLHI